MASMIVPPGGFAGFSQMTPASRVALSQVGGSRAPRSGTRRRRKAKGAKATRRAKSGGGRRMKFGSPAWQKKYKVGKFRKKR